MGGRREIEAKKKWGPKRGGRLKWGGRPEGNTGQKKVAAKTGWEAETGWDDGGK